MTFQTFVPTDVETALGGRFTVGRKVASGGQGAVFQATRTATADGTPTNDLVALKLHFDPRQAIRVQREVTALEGLSHPNIARLIEHGHCYVTNRRTRYIAYEYIEGQSLKQRLKTGGRMLETEVLPIARDISAAIEALWAQRIVHGDIKPGNIMLRDTGDAVLIDLGVLRFVEEYGANRPFTPVARFSAELVRGWGTPGYCSPEQARGEQLSCASDIFSLGVVLVECLQGWHPTGHNQNELAMGLHASALRLDATLGLLSVLDKMLVEVPRSRGRLEKLSGYFQSLLDRTAEQFARGTQARDKRSG